MFYNVSNHPVKYWEREQVLAAEELGGKVCDVPFPEVSPADSFADIAAQARRLARHLLETARSGDVFHVMGELTFAFSLVALLQQGGMMCVASTTERHVTYDKANPDAKISSFRFVRFRQYPPLNGLDMS